MNSQSPKKETLKQILEALKESKKTLNHSLKLCSGLEKKSSYSLEDLDKLEALTSRFSRVSDILIQKAFRAIDDIELVDSGSILDRIQRAHKRELIESADEFIQIRELRNSIAHEYKITDLNEIFRLCILKSPTLVRAIDKVIEYCKKHHEIES
ncbi:MAG: hypothetical protein D6797_01640 [Bdellovibrio sp.]|nr:MAG: hypothetical protein D6797_01640 [Bdellovibrio sp.]